MYHEFVIVGRQKLENGKQHKLYRMRIFAKNAVSARNRFWYFLSRLRKVFLSFFFLSFVFSFLFPPSTSINFNILLRKNFFLSFLWILFFVFYSSCWNNLFSLSIYYRSNVLLVRSFRSTRSSRTSPTPSRTTASPSDSTASTTPTTSTRSTEPCLVSRLSERCTTRSLLSSLLTVSTSRLSLLFASPRRTSLRETCSSSSYLFLFFFLSCFSFLFIYLIFINVFFLSF